MSRVLVTGATGFVGRTLCEELARAGFVVRAALRSQCALPAWIAESVVVGDIGALTEWQAALGGVERVVHAAACAHVMSGGAAAAAHYLDTNELGTQRLAQQAAQSGVQRFIYLSSIKVNGGEVEGRAYRSDDPPNPQDDYARSKLAGEIALLAETARAPMQAVIVRAPLVYGAHVRANFLRLMQWTDREQLLPFALVRNRRSLLSVWNLSDLVQRLLVHPRAAGVWLASDGEDLATPELIRRLARALGRRARLLPVPPLALQASGALVGRAAEARRLCGSLVLDGAPARELLHWCAPLSVDEGLARTVAWYRAVHPA